MLELEHEIGGLIIKTLSLEEVSTGDIDPEAPLFRDGLGLDSIDALEMSLAISSNYGVQLRADNVDVNEVFSSLRALTAFVQENRQR
jgi:acyl carrier protein